jgi:hypothetical protein
MHGTVPCTPWARRQEAGWEDEIGDDEEEAIRALQVLVSRTLARIVAHLPAGLWASTVEQFDARGIRGVVVHDRSGARIAEAMAIVERALRTDLRPTPARRARSRRQAAAA